VSRSRGSGLLGLAALVASAALGCAGSEPSLAALRASAEARIWRGPTMPRTSDTVAKLLGEPLTADTASRVALLNNRRILAGYERLGIAHGELEHALRLPNPSAEVAVRFPKGGDPDFELMALLGLSELALLPGRTEAAQASIQAERLEMVALIVDLAFDVRAALVSCQAAEQALELAQSVLAATQASADAAARMAEAGNLTELELASERAFSEEARVAERSAETERGRARSRLASLLGLAAGTEWSTAPRLRDLPPNELPLDTLERQAVEQSLDLAIAKQRALAADRLASSARVEGLVPEIRAGVSARHEGAWGVGPAAAVELPLFYQGQGKVDAARAELREQENLYAARTVELKNAAQTAGARLKAARESALEYHDVLLPLRQRVLDQTELEYNAMAVGVFQLLQAKRQEIETARAYVALLGEYWLARNEVERLEAGRLGPGEARP
jgi:cobalt-zinc-cadmium efflux system outer membrane protein